MKLSPLFVILTPYIAEKQIEPMLYYSKLFLTLQRLYLVFSIVNLIVVLTILFLLQILSLSELKIVDFC